MNKTKRMEYLIKQLNMASDAYYGGREEVMSNYEWDALFDELESIEKETGYILPNSPTHFISRSKSDDSPTDNKEPHEFPALSLAKTKRIEDLVNWADGKDIWVSWKLDGLTLVLTYDNGRLVKVLTRGDGLTGTNITFFKECIKGFPLRIDEKSHVVVRGEATISYSDFEVINDINETGEKYANPRNLAAGTLSLDPQKREIVKNRKINFIAFSLIYIDKNILSWGGRLDYLDALGFNTVEREKTTAKELPQVVKKWSHRVNENLIDTPVDGLVICYDDTLYAATGSVTGHHATRAGLAFKWQDQVAITTLKHIEWSCSTSVITPVAVFEPIKLEGTMVSRASLCNISELERLGIGEDGKTILQIIKANKIIPKCVGVIKKEGQFSIPSECPVCNEKTTIVVNPTSNTKVLRCTNSSCPAKNLSRYVRFTSKLGVNIDGLSIKTINTFINKGFIKKFQDIYELKNYADIICRIDGFGEKSCSKLLKSIEKSKQVNAINFIYSLSIPLIGIDAAKRIINEIGYREFLFRIKAKQGFEDISGIGIEKSKAIINWFANKDNADTFVNLNNILEITQTFSENTSNLPCNGLVFVITGELIRFKNRDEMISFIEARGGKIRSSVSSRTDYLINNDFTSNSGKNKKAKELGIKIISEEEFISRFN